MALWDDESHGLIAHKVCWCLVSLTTVVIALRFYARLTAQPGNPFGALGLDDAFAGLSWAVLLLTQIFIQVAADHGNGRHYDGLSRPQQIEVMKWNTIIEAVIIWAFSLPKLAIVALLRRILMFGLRTSVVLWGLAFVGQVLIFSTSVFIFIQCNPAEKNWNKDVDGICLPDSTIIAIEYFVSSYSAFLDMFFALFPVPFVMRLNMPLKTRIAVSTALSIGVLAGIVQAYKLSILGTSFKYTTLDPTYPLPFLNLFCLLEACLLLITCSLPALGSLVRKAKDYIHRVNEISRSNISTRSPTPRVPNKTFELNGASGAEFMITVDREVHHPSSQARDSDQSEQATLTDDQGASSMGRYSTLLDVLLHSSPVAASSPRGSRTESPLRPVSRQ
ncbi:hypothetical protein BKA67DRAFT_552241 [Truncatella angustata]|uniref:Rhodopsin domain-containing protein n=1 Tax=Truncatella angustata TaxID=152316 RepID=A0A9P8UQT3_9PEZI|nr:uncharacterized protein BKA67DRAFT_552241 [Truncatella angustata]KAH6656529.1 hypothetical protein BKA67DRAFT_552241 [Truncatella angustata]KAH8194366.1 hypothetical protein TruAng_011464 [Truncatella angustata]